MQIEIKINGEPKEIADLGASKKNKHKQLPLVYTYAIPKIHATDIIATDSDNEAIRYMGEGYTLFTVPQMFGCEKGIITLYRTADSTPIKDGAVFLERYKRNSKAHISGGSKSCDHKGRNSTKNDE